MRTLKGNGKSFRQGRRNLELERERKEAAIKGLNLRSCLERYGLFFNMQGAALCPFHKEKTASFRVNGRFWHCFGCGESGELIKFVRKKYGLSYDGALDTICKDFGIVAAAPTIADRERLDLLKLERYNCIRRYAQLLDDLDVYTRLYWLAVDILEYTIEFCGGNTVENDLYVSAQFALMNAQKALEQAEFDCAQYARANPSAVPKPVQKATEAHKRLLPPAPKWG